MCHKSCMPPETREPAAAQPAARTAAGLRSGLLDKGRFVMLNTHGHDTHC